jgi:hypothetical protein
MRVALVLLLIACEVDEPYVEQPPPPGSDVPMIAGGWLDPAPRDAIIVSERDVRVRSGSVIGAPILTLRAHRLRAEDKQGGEHGYHVPALEGPIGELSAGRVGLAFAPDTPYRTVCDVVYTLGQRGRSELALLVRRGERVMSLPFDLPAIGPGGSEAPVGVQMQVTGDSVVVHFERVRTTLLRRDGTLDLPAIARALERFDRSAPLTVYAEPDVPIRDIAAAIAVSRGSRDRPLFTRFALSIGAR